MCILKMREIFQKNYICVIFEKNKLKWTLRLIKGFNSTIRSKSLKKQFGAIYKKMACFKRNFELVFTKKMFMTVKKELTWDNRFYFKKKPLSLILLLSEEAKKNSNLCNFWKCRTAKLGLTPR